MILVFVAGYVVYGYLNGLPPQVISSGPSRQTYLDVPLMTFYTPSIPGASDFNVTLTVVFATGEHFPFAWEGVAGTPLPVRFALEPSDGFATGPSNGFTYTTAVGWSSIGVEGPHSPGAYVSLWSLNYTVREMSAWEGFTKATWLQVDYSILPVSLFVGAPLPVANISAPTASDLLPTGIVDSLNFTVQPGYLWPIAHDIYNASTPWPSFHHALPAVTFDAGDGGRFTASLASSFQWAKGDNYRVAMSFSGSLHGWATWYWDARFGSLFAVFSS